MCQRVVIINDGRIQFDGSLAGIVDRFHQERIVSLRLADSYSMDELAAYGRITKLQAPQVQLRIPRAEITTALAEILNRFPVEDVSVSDPPLEEIFAHLCVSGHSVGSGTGQADGLAWRPTSPRDGAPESRRVLPREGRR